MGGCQPVPGRGVSLVLAADSSCARVAGPHEHRRTAVRPFRTLGALWLDAGNTNYRMAHELSARLPGGVVRHLAVTRAGWQECRARRAVPGSARGTELHVAGRRHRSCGCGAVPPLCEERRGAGAYAALPRLTENLSMNVLPFLRPLALAAALGLGVSGGAAAAEYTSLDAEASNLSFGYSQMNVKMDGAFSELSATELSFDPAQPEAAKVVIEVPLSSIDAGYAEANSELEKEEWLALNAHPVASFASK